MEQYIKPFITACTDVFKGFLGYNLITGYPFFITREKAQDWDISGVIGLSGEARGAVALSMKSETALLITEKLTGQTHSYLDEEVVDAVGEMTNIIAGNAKQRLEDTFNLSISIPSIIKGAGHRILWSGEHVRIMCIPFKMIEDHSFYLSVALIPNKGV